MQMEARNTGTLKTGVFLGASRSNSYLSFSLDRAETLMRDIQS